MSTNTNNDAIGETVFSKQWLIECLLKLVKFVESEPSEFVYNNESSNLDMDSIEEGPCILWDMSSNEDVQKFLIENQADKIFSNIVIKTNNPRLAELSFGILGNLSHNKEISDSISSDRQFCITAVSLLSASDLPFLIQLIRFLNTVLHNNENNWLSLIEESSSSFFEHVEYLFINCLNIDLLKSLFQYINDVLYKRADLAKFWWENDHQLRCISTLRQACHQILTSLDNDSDTAKNDNQFFYNFWFVTEMLLINNAQIMNCDFIEHLEELKELFVRFEQFLDCSLNSISSFSACCTVLMRFASIETKNVEEKERLKTFMRNMSKDDVVLSTFAKYKSCLEESLERFPKDQDQDKLGQTYSNVEELYCLIFPLGKRPGPASP